MKRLLFPPFPDARKSEFLPPVQRDATRPVPHAKIFRFAVDPNQQYDLRVPSRKECIGHRPRSAEDFCKARSIAPQIAKPRQALFAF